MNIDQVARAAGVNCDTLRQWEARYGWPKPERQGPSRYRCYHQWQVDEIVRVAALMRASGMTIGQIVINERPVFPTETVKKAPTLAFTDLPLPYSDEARAIRSRMERALETVNLGEIRACEAMLPRIRPSERALAFTGLIEEARAKGVAV